MYTFSLALRSLFRTDEHYFWRHGEVEVLRALLRRKLANTLPYFYFDFLSLYVRAVNAAGIFSYQLGNYSSLLILCTLLKLILTTGRYCKGKVPAEPNYG